MERVMKLGKDIRAYYIPNNLALDWAERLLQAHAIVPTQRFCFPREEHDPSWFSRLSISEEHGSAFVSINAKWDCAVGKPYLVLIRQPPLDQDAALEQIQTALLELGAVEFDYFQMSS